MQVRLLGPLDVVVDGVSRPVRGLRRKAVLAVLALQPGEVVSAGRLIDVVWGDAPPSTVANTLQQHVSHLRNVLGGRAAIVARSPGYVLDLGAGATDVAQAEELIRSAQRASDLAKREGLLRSALRLWRGAPLMDLAGLVWLEEQATRLDQLRLRASHGLIEARLALGEHAELVPELERLISENALDEQLQRQLILALYRAGRQADALAAYRRLKATLGEQLGIDPSQELRELETAILRQDPALQLEIPGGPPAPRVTSSAAMVPAQLPMTVRAFAGREPLVADLDATLSKLAHLDPPATMVVAVSGTAGVGKTALALYWAHRVAEQFPDGQLYVDLAGFGAQPVALEPAAVVRGFLEALGVAANRMPASPEAQAGLYRTLVAGRRLLILLDNARDAAQVRPLLPSSPGSVVLVTSRHLLTGLIAEGAIAFTVDLFTKDEARELLSQRVGAERVAAEPAAVNEIIERCARLPLALAVAAARSVARPGFPLRVLADELREAGGPLDLFHGGDSGTDVRSVLSWSYQALSQPAARLYRLLGAAPGPDISASAAASLAGLPGRVANHLLAELVRANLVSEHRPGRFSFHDLLRADAVDRARGGDPAEDRRAALVRLVNHHVYSALHAARLVYPPGELPDAGPMPDGITPERPGDVDRATEWFVVERAVVSFVVATATAAGLDRQVVLIAAAWASYLTQRCRYADQAEIQLAAVAAAERAGDHIAQARARRVLGWAASGLDDRDGADVHFGRALALYTELGDDAGLGRTHYSVTLTATARGDYPAALTQARLALVHHRRTGDRVGIASAENALAWVHALLGDTAASLVHSEEALALLANLDAPHVAAPTLDTLAHVRDQLGETTVAVQLYRESIRLWRSCGDRMGEGLTWVDLGDVYDRAGEAVAAVSAWREALDILDEMGLPQVGEVRTRLASRRR